MTFLHEMSDDTLRALAKELCEAKEGSRELDYRIAEVLGRETMRDAQGSFAPWKYTTSLDAKLPGEDIRVVFAPGHEGNDENKPAHKWAALNAISGGRIGVWAYARTEPLARRAAALLAMAEQKERKE